MLTHLSSYSHPLLFTAPLLRARKRTQGYRPLLYFACVRAFCAHTRRAWPPESHTLRSRKHVSFFGRKEVVCEFSNYDESNFWLLMAVVSFGASRVAHSGLLDQRSQHKWLFE